MLQLFLERHLFQDQVIDTAVYQQDGASPNFDNIIRDHLNDVFPNSWIGRGSPRIRAPHSPELMPFDFFAWGYIKAQVYQVKIMGGSPGDLSENPVT